MGVANEAVAVEPASWAWLTKQWRWNQHRGSARVVGYPTTRERPRCWPGHFRTLFFYLLAPPHIILFNLQVVFSITFKVHRRYNDNSNQWYDCKEKTIS